MVTKVVPDLPLFGRYLALIRKKAGVKSQRQAALMTERLRTQGIDGIPLLTSSQVYSDEKGLVSDIPSDRLEAYSILYKVSLEEIIAHLVEEKYSVTRTEKMEVSVSEIPDIVPPEEREAYELLRHLLDTKSREGVLTCLRMISGDDAGKLKRSPVTPEEETRGAA
jgi:hypothetical protein